jgi:uncharacterized protein DUF664
LPRQNTGRTPAGWQSGAWINSIPRHDAGSPPSGCGGTYERPPQDEDADFNDVDQGDPAEAFNAFERDCAASRRVVAQAPSLDVLSKQASERTGQPWSLRGSSPT